MAVLYELGNKSLDFIKGMKFLEEVSDWQVFKKDCSFIKTGSKGGA